MDLQRSLKRGITRGVRLVMREKWGMTFFALLSVVLLLQFLVASLLGVRGVTTLLTTRGDLQLEVVAGAADRDVQELYAALRELPFVDSVTFVSQEQAFENERTRDPGLVAFLEKYKMQNPFPDTFSLTLVSLQFYDSLRTFVEQPQWKSVVHPSFLSSVTDQEQRVRSLLKVTRAVGAISGLFLLLSGIALTLVIIELVRRRAQRRSSELRLEEYLGASSTDVLLPFVVEMAALLLLSLLVASILVLVAFWFLPMFSSTFSSGSFVTLRSELTHLFMALGVPLLLLEVLLTPVLAYGGAMMGLRAHR